MNKDEMNGVSNELVEETPNAGEKADFPTQAWIRNYSLYNELQFSTYIIELKKGNLNPSRYGPTSIQEIYQEFSFVQAINTTQVSDYNQQKIFNKMKDAYNRFETWHLSSDRSLIGTTNNIQYYDFISSVGRQYDGIYVICALLPNIRIRGMLTYTYGPFEETNIYKSWIDVNTPFFNLIADVENYIRSWSNSSKPFDESLANDLYDRAFRYQTIFYNQARTGESISALLSKGIFANQNQ